MRVLMIVVAVYICFILESVLSSIFGRWFAPNLLLLLVIFFNLFRGIRYSILTALLAGILQDSYSPGPMGLSVFSFVACAYLTTIIKAYIYQPGSLPSRVLLVFVISVINVSILSLLHMISTTVDLGDVFQNILLPEVTATCVVTGYAFKHFRQCALRLSV